jgi:hypothetical protein
MYHSAFILSDPQDETPYRHLPAYFNILRKSLLAPHDPVTCYGDLYLLHFTSVIPIIPEA